MTATPIAPAIGAKFAAPTSPATYKVAFEFQGAVPGSSFAAVEVSRTPTVGQDGTLANDLRVGDGIVQQRDSDPSRFAGVATVAFQTTPGTYYYQYSESVVNSADTTNCPNSPPWASCVLASPIYSFTVEAVQPAAQPQTATPQNAPRPLTVAAAKTAARYLAVHAWGAHKPKVASTHRVSASQVTCRLTWRTKAGKKRSRTVKVKRTSMFGVEAHAA
jgi:hypothetical protein